MKEGVDLVFGCFHSLFDVIVGASALPSELLLKGIISQIELAFRLLRFHITTFLMQ